MYLGVLRFIALKPSPLRGISQKCASKVSKSGLTNLAVWQLRGDEGQALAGLAERNMKLSCTIQEESVYLEGLELRPLRLQ